jgi:hypothetical protein
MKPNTDVFIIHDSRGHIVGAGHAPAGSTYPVEVTVAGDRGVLRVSMDEAELASLSDLHRTHEVNVHDKVLRPRSKAGA